MRSMFYLTLAVAVVLSFCGLGFAQTYDLDVQSTPPVGVSIASDSTHGGVTNYSITDILENTPVNLRAPVTDPVNHQFVRWVINGADQAEGQKNITFLLNENTTAVATYQFQFILYDLAVQSTPPDGVPISSTSGHDGTTDYVIQGLIPGSNINLEAPAIDPVGWTFVRWSVNDVGQPDGQKSISFSITQNTTAVAVYSGNDLIVQSAPIAGVEIASGTGHEGTTFYSILNIPGGTPINLEAPADDPENYVFVQWEIDGIPQAPGVKAVNFNITGETTAIAVYSVAFNLNVESDGADAVPIGSTTGHGGVTNYTIEDIATGTTINLNALATVGELTFIRWTLNGLDHPDQDEDLQQTSISFELNQNITAVAIYAEPYTLTVSADPVRESRPCWSPENLIIGSTTGHGGVIRHIAGINEYTHDVDHFTMVNLIAPTFPTLTGDPEGYLFQHWLLNGEVYGVGKEITFILTEDVEAVAVYRLRSYQVSVASTPTPSQFISSNSGNAGGTNYVTVVYHFDTLHLEAPLICSPTGRTRFSRWEINGELKSPGHNVYQVTCYAVNFPTPNYPDPNGYVFATAHYEFMFHGTIWAWGINEFGQLGDGTSIERTLPVQTDGADSDVDLSGGKDHSLALRGDGIVWAWGRNQFGQIGDGTNTNRSSPVVIPGISGIVNVSSGYHHSLALRGNGTIFSWGSNEYGQLGTGYVGNHNTPQRVMMELWEPRIGFTNVAAIDAGHFHSLALRADGSVWAWGRNNDGQVGDGTTNHRYLPRQVVLDGPAVAISAGAFHSMALMADGTMRAWGNNQYGQLGDRTTTRRLTPVPVLVPLHTLSVRSTPPREVPIASDSGHGGTTNYSVVVPGDSAVTLTAPATFTEILDPEEPVDPENPVVPRTYEFRRWRLGGVGQTVGLATITFTMTNNITAEAVYLQLDPPDDDDNGDDDNGDDDNGDDDNGDDDNGDLAALDDPIFTLDTTQFANAAGISAGGYHSVVLRNDGSVHTWGRNDFGQLGLGSASAIRTAPRRVLGIGAMVDIAAGGFHTLALRGDGWGAVWAWGKNTNGQLGDKTRTHRASPIRIPGIDLVGEIGAGVDHSLAAQPSAGFVWGRNDSYNVYARRGVNLGTPEGIGWQQHPGRLSHVSVGSDRMWGVNRQNNIYFRPSIMADNNPWEWVAGSLSQISVGPNGDVWGIQSWNGNIYLRSGITLVNPAGTGWTRIPGTLSNISVGANGVWGIYPNGRVYYRDSVIDDATPWVRVPGILRRISIGPTGAVWGVNPSGLIYIRMGITGGNPMGTHWQQVTGRLVDVAVGDGIVWGINSSGYVYFRLGVEYDAAIWVRVPGILRQLDVAGTAIPGPAPITEYPYIQPLRPDADNTEETPVSSGGESWSTLPGGYESAGPITVVILPPVADAGGDKIAPVGRYVIFDGSGSRAPSGEILGYEWDLNGNGRIDSYGVTAGTIFPSAGVFKVTLRVRDNHGGTDVDTATVVVR